ncbi:ribosome maturation factor RimM [Flammeovirga kamogawensis]|uniref:Ribosome maturation factor RimM n=1 Tax=Flammeovirga kamogawensis TaxID=373891 RepID=A0ABX8GSU7_9BACT|nr:ribosome maturation factor RimM [Flammeovirga kamogawensis]MBB6463359.1 16S rRNA processing protein RimM [Flammeovirga kamogawensis]QWG06669.1 ribosome maturation factor RimM [Flammeovirga kamogawensis]TRX68491.1 16S rRNA processing protein RimM [Flammeovirga kamogawensis]
MHKDDCFEFGKITKTHGLKGEVLFFLDVDDPSKYEGIDAVFIERRGNLVPFFLEYLSLHNNRYIAKFEDIDTIEDAEALKDAQLFLPMSALPKLPEGQFYYHDIVDFKVVDQNLGELGTVSKIYTNSAQDILEMEYKGKEVLIPISDDIILTAELDNKVLNTNLPEGLLDIYME